MTQPAPDLTKLSDAEIIDHLLEAEADETAAKLARKKLNNELLNRHAAQIKAAYDGKPEPFGVVNLDIAGKVIKIDTPKKVEWAQNQLETIWNQMVEGGDNPRNYIKIEYTISETLYKTFGDNQKKFFSPARTVKSGNPSIKIANGEE